MKQKIVIKAVMTCTKCRTKTMEIAATTPGVSSVTVEGDETVIMLGENLDIASIVRSLRKKNKAGNISVVSVEQVKEEEEIKEEKNNVARMEMCYPYPHNYYFIPSYHATPYLY